MTWGLAIPEDQVVSFGIGVSDDIFQNNLFPVHAPLPYAPSGECLEPAMQSDFALLPLATQTKGEDVAVGCFLTKEVVNALFLCFKFNFYSILISICIYIILFIKPKMSHHFPYEQ